jgi:hypothetical protein
MNPIEATSTKNTVSPMDGLRQQIEKNRATIEAEAETVPEKEIVEATIADVAAAAFVALETIVQMLKPDDATRVLDVYEARRAQYAEGNEAAEQAQGQS